MTDVDLTIATLEITASAPAEVDVERRTITGVVIPPGNQAANTSAGRVRFRAGSLIWSDPRRVALLREHQADDAVGFGLRLSWDADGGLRGTYRVADGPNGDRALSDAVEGIRNGLSVGAADLVTELAADGVLDVTAGRVRETSLVTVPAFDDSRVTSVAASLERNLTVTTVAPPAPPAAAPAAPAPTDLTASELLDQLRSLLSNAAPVAVPPTAPPPATVPNSGPRDLNLSGFVDLVRAHNLGRGNPTELRAALSDIVPADMPSAFRPQYLTELWEGSDYVRKFIDNATVTKPLTGLKVIGQRWSVAPEVADYTGNKADVPSNEPVLVDIPVDAKRLAGAHDVDRAFIDLGSAEWLTAYFEAQTESYRRKSDAAAAAQAWTDAVDLVDAGPDATPTTFSTLLEGVIQAVVEMASLGEGVDYVAMAPGLITELFGITVMDAPAFFSGSFKLSASGDGAMGDVTWFTTPGLSAGKFLVGSKIGTRYHEVSPPIRVQAVNVAQGGIDLGVFGYYATYNRNAAQTRAGLVGA